MTAPEQSKTYSLSEEGVTAALADLDKGGSEDVAIRLAELGILGIQGDDCACPVANYLARALPNVETVTVARGEVYARGTVYEDLDGFPQPLDVLLHAELPDSVDAFVADFDAGVYPDLIQEAAA